MKVKAYILGIDPSGSFKEGKGTTGMALLSPEGHIHQHETVTAKDYPTQVNYWAAVLDQIDYYKRNYPDLVLSVEDYVLYATSAKAQINSEMETSKLIGAITMHAYRLGIRMYIRSASQVVNRWSNEILIYKEIIFKKNNRYVDRIGVPINQHCLDAVRHAVHCQYFELTKER